MKNIKYSIKNKYSNINLNEMIFTPNTPSSYNILKNYNKDYNNFRNKDSMKSINKTTSKNNERIKNNKKNNIKKTPFNKQYLRNSKNTNLSTSDYAKSLHLFFNHHIENINTQFKNYNNKTINLQKNKYQYIINSNSKNNKNSSEKEEQIGDNIQINS